MSRNCGNEIAAGLRERWSAEIDPDKKNQIAGTLVNVLSGHATPAELLEFLRVQLEKGPQEYRANYVSQLFETLLSQPWSAEYENEAFGLLERLSDSEEPAQRLMAQIAGLYRMTDRMVQARFDARMRAIEHQEKLTRTELAAKRAENLKAAREGFADRLREEARKRQPPLSRWMTIERVYLDVLLNRNLDQAEGECWELLGPGVAKSLAEGDPATALEEVLRNRCLATLANLAARKTAKPASVDRLLQYLDKAIAADAEDIRFRLFKVQLLIALDRPKDLQQALEGWIKAGDADNRWRQALAYLLAEQGRLEQAIGLFEAIRASDELGPTDYRALADWYMAVGRKDDYRQAMIAVYKTVQEWQLSNSLWRKLDPWRRPDRTPSGQLDDEVLLVFAALFEKASQPAEPLAHARGVLSLDSRFPPLGGAGRRRDRPHRRQGLSLLAEHGSGPPRDPGRGHRRFARRADRQGRAPTRVGRGRRPTWTGGPWTCWRCSSSAGRRNCRTSPGPTASGPWPPCSGPSGAPGPPASPAWWLTC